MALEGGGGDDLDKYLTDLIRMSKNIELKEKWINPNTLLKQATLQLFPDACRNHHVFDHSTQEHPKTCVTIRSIRGTCYEGVRDHTSLAVYAGGPGSMIGAALNSALSLSGGSGKVLYVTYDFKHSNARSSAYYFHIRHSNALSADSLVRGPNILYEFCRRQLMPSSQLEAETRKLDYLKVDLSLRGLLSSPAHCLNTLKILAVGLYHTYRNVLIDAVSPMGTDWAENRNYSKCSVPVLRYLELVGRKLGIASDTPQGQPFLLLGTEPDSDVNTSKAIHVVFDERGAKHVELENAALLKTNQIASRELTSLEVTATMNSASHNIHKAYVYPGDGRIRADMNVTLKEIVEKTGNSWQEGVVVDSVYIDERGVRGVLMRDTGTKKTWYQPCSSVVLSLGYSASYEYEQPRQLTHSIRHHARSLLSYAKWKVGLSHPVPKTTIATGCSGYFLVRGKIPIIGAQNSHWTEVAYSPEEDLTLAKLTGGGNIGSEYIPATYALNNLEHLKKLFKDSLVDVLSIDSCPRAINPKNDVQFYRLAPGLVISLGLGGTGMTKSGANGALSYLLSASSPADPVPGHPDLFAGLDTGRLVNECTADTLRALNLTDSLSATELLSLCAVGVGATYTARRVFQTFIEHRKRSHHSRPSQSPSHIRRNVSRIQASCNLRLLPLLHVVLKSLRRIRP